MHQEGAQATAERQRFTGKRWDAATGLYYSGARYYDPEIGRFISRDPAFDGLNWFVYARSNPLRYVDPTGLSALTLIGTWGLLSAAGGAGSALIQYWRYGKVDSEQVICDTIGTGVALVLIPTGPLGVAFGGSMASNTAEHFFFNKGTTPRDVLAQSIEDTPVSFISSKLGGRLNPLGNGVKGQLAQELIDKGVEVPITAVRDSLKNGPGQPAPAQTYDWEPHIRSQSLIHGQGQGHLLHSPLPL